MQNYMNLKYYIYQKDVQKPTTQNKWAVYIY